jgi:F0F1-type ATP synthase epsilon subunit
MPAALRLEIFTAEKKILSVAHVLWLRIELVDGSIGIRPGHAPLVAETASGPLIYADEQGEHRVNLLAGVLDIHGGVVSIFTSVINQEKSLVDASPKSFNRLIAETFSEPSSGELDAE